VKLQKDLREFVELLGSKRVEYIIVGAHAVAFHAHPRFTGDIDFLVRGTPENARRLVAVLEAFGFTSLGLTPQDFLAPANVVQLGQPPNRIDILTSISGVDFEEAWASRVHGDLDGLPVVFLGLDALIKNKQSAGRDKDLVDARILSTLRSKPER
jgi:hypothetical protein